MLKVKTYLLSYIFQCNQKKWTRSSLMGKQSIRNIILHLLLLACMYPIFAMNRLFFLLLFFFLSFLSSRHLTFRSVYLSVWQRMSICTFNWSKWRIHIFPSWIFSIFLTWTIFNKIDLLMFPVSRHRDLTLVKDLIKEGADVNLCPPANEFASEDGVPPLYYATAGQDGEIVSLLLNAGNLFSKLDSF